MRPGRPVGLEIEIKASQREETTITWVRLVKKGLKRAISKLKVTKKNRKYQYGSRKKPLRDSSGRRWQVCRLVEHRKVLGGQEL